MLKQPGKILVGFHAAWCVPCQEQIPILESLEEQLKESNPNQEFPGKDKGIKFAIVDIDESINISSHFQVMVIPTFILFKDGEPVHRVNGFQSESALREILNDSD